MRERLRKFAGTPQYQPIYLKEDITQDELAFIKSHRNELPELDTIMAHRRLYPRNGFLAHLVGYVGEVSEKMLNQASWELYNPGDVVGRSGVELEYNPILMGKNVDSRSTVALPNPPGPAWRLRDAALPGLGCADSVVEFRSVEVMDISGQGSRSRP